MSAEIASVPSPSNLPSTSPKPPPLNPTNTFQYPAYTHFPPFYTIQPNATTLSRQLDLWTSLLLSYSAHHNLYTLSLSTPPADLFTNKTLSRSLKPADIRTLLNHMSTPAGGQTIEWIPPASKTEQSNSVWVWWKSASEWADLIYGWVEGTGQKGAVLTVYELREEGGGKGWVGMEEGMLRKVLQVLVKRGRAQVFNTGGGDGEGVKFF